MKCPQWWSHVDEVTAIGAEIGATGAQTALAWILTRGDDIAPTTAKVRANGRSVPPG